MPNGTIELWRGRAMYPKLEVTHTTADYAIECVGSNYLLWSVVYDSGAPLKKCKRCPETHMLGWKRKQPPQRIVEYGEPVDGFVPMDPSGDIATHTNTKHYHPDSPKGSRKTQVPDDNDGYPVVRYRDLGPDGSRQFKAFLSCNSHFHGHHLFHIKVQLVELNALGEIIRTEVAYSPRIKVVSKFLDKKGTKALPVEDVRKFLSMESLRKRRKLANLSAIAGAGLPFGASSSSLPFPTAADETRRRKIPADMTQLAAAHAADLEAAAAAAAAAASVGLEDNDTSRDMELAGGSAPASSSSTSSSLSSSKRTFPAAWTLPPEIISPGPAPSSAPMGAPLPSGSSLMARAFELPTLHTGFSTHGTAMDLARPSSANYSKVLSPGSTSLFADPLLGGTSSPLINLSSEIHSSALFSSPLSSGSSSSLSTATTSSSTAAASSSLLSSAPPPSSIASVPSSLHSIVTGFQSLSVQDRRAALLAIGADPLSWQVLKTTVLELSAQRAELGYDSE